MTNYMGLTTINSSDYITPSTINENFQKLDVLGLDYVTESGTSGEWWYRKWKSGRAECGIDNKQFAEFSNWTPSGLGGYRSPDFSFGAYPFSFASRPFTSIIFEGDANNADRGSYCVPRNSTSTTLSPSFFIMDGMQKSMKPTCGIFVIGRYK